MVTVIVAYAPTEDASPEDKLEFYDDLSSAINSEPPHNVTIVLGDFNARVGSDSHHHHSQVIGKHNYHLSTNDNGKRLLDLCHTTNQRHVQSRFPHPPKRMWTWKHPIGSLAQLDHILVNSKWIRSVTNCRAYNSVEIDSDHRILSARFNIRFRASKGKSNLRTRFN